MKFECITEKFLSGVSVVSRVATKHLTLPVLQCVLLEVKGSKLFLRSTNLELGIEVVLPVTSSTDGKVAVSADLLRNYLSSIQNERTMSVSSDTTTLSFSTKHTSTILKTFSPDEFPSLPKVESKKQFKFKTKDLIEGFKSVLHSASISSMKPELSSVYMYSDGEFLVFVATDSFRLSEKKIPFRTEGFDSLLVPQKNAIEIVRILEGSGGEETSLLPDTSQLALEVDGTYITSRVVEGVFPDYQQIVPKESSTNTTVLLKDVTNALKVGSLFTDKFNKISLGVSTKENKLSIKTQNMEVGENVTVVDSQCEGGDVEMNFNSRYINDGLSSITTESISLGLSEGKPMVIKGVGDASFMYLVMAMNK